MKRPALSELTLRQKIGQLLMLSTGELLMKKELDETGERVRRSYAEIDEIMEKYQYGSLWAWAGVRRNPNLPDGFEFTYQMRGWMEIGPAEDYKAFIDRISEKLRIPLIVGGDSERGCGHFIGGTGTVGAYNIGAANDCELAYKLNAGISAEEKAGGIQWRFGPVVDIHNRYCSIASGRTFSDDHKKIVDLAVASVRGTESVNVAATVKHFPGADPYDIRDGHVVTSAITIPLEEWEKTQGKIFQEVIDAGVLSVMTTHKTFPPVDDTLMGDMYTPATFSKKIVTGLLREKMGFEGVIITDDISMGGMANACSREDSLIYMINAGHDVLLGVQPYDAEVVYQAVMDGRIPMERIDESCERVLIMKEKIGLFDEKQETMDMAQANAIVQEANQAIAEKSITMLRDRNNMIPLKKEAIKRVTIIASSNTPGFTNSLNVMKAEFEARGAEVKIVDTLIRAPHLEKIDAESDLIIYAGYVAPHQPVGMPSLYGDAMKTYWAAFSYGKEKSIGVSMGYPYLHIDAMQGANTFFNIYTNNALVQKSFVKALYGEIPIEGVSPVDLEPKLRLIYG